MDRVGHGMFFARQGWYPVGPEDCQRQVQRLVDEGRRQQWGMGAMGGKEPGAEKLGAEEPGAEEPGAEEVPEHLPGRAGVVPHAGWMFSGTLAASVFDSLARRVGPVDTVVLLGGHLGPRSAGWVLTSGLWPTPLGDVEVDSELAKALGEAADLCATDPRGYEPDNTIELQLPFVKALFPESRLVVAGVSANEGAEDVGRRAVSLGASLGRSTVVVGSTDLTHYGPSYGFEPAGKGPEAVAWVKEENDRRAVDLMVSLSAEALRREALDAHFCCCPGAAAAALGAAKEAGAITGNVLGRLTSYDVRPGTSFVGYVAVVF